MTGIRIQEGTGKRLWAGGWFLACLLLVCTLARVALSVFPRIITVYPDEQVNLQLAQGIHLFGRLAANGGDTAAPGILYPALLSPFYGIPDPEIRLKAISVLNALLVSSALVPAWLLCRRLLRKNLSGLAALALFVLSPNLWVSVSFMADSLFIPMALWGILFLFRGFEQGSPGPRASCGLGLWMYLLFLASQAGTALAAAALGLFIYEAAAGRNEKKALTAAACFIGAFGAAYLAGMFLLFGGKPCHYPVLFPETPQQLLFLLVAAAGLLLHFMTGLLLFPAVLPVTGLKRREAAYRKRLVVLLVYSVFAALLTAASVSVPGDFGSMDIRVVLRMFTPAGWLFMLAWLETLETEDTEKTGLRHPAVITVAVLVFAGLVILRAPRLREVTDAPMLLAAGKLNAGLKPALVKAVPAALFLAGLALLAAGRKKVLAVCITVCLLAGNVLNGVSLLRQAREEGMPPAEEIRSQAKELDGFLDGLEGNILFVRNDVPDEAERLTDTYCRTVKCRSIGLTELRRLAGCAEDPGQLSPEEAGLGMDRVDCLICPGETFSRYSAGGEEITPETVSYMHVYRNGQPDRLDLTDLLVVRPGESIRFAKENPEHRGYPAGGFSNPESGFTWTEGPEATITFVPVSEGNTPVDLVWTRKMTNGGEQKCRVYADGELLFDGAVRGEGELRLPLPQAATEKDGPVTFRFELPDARQPDNGDPRLLAVAFVSLSLAER